MHTYWAFVRTDVGAFTRVTIQADDPHNAYKLLKMLYGKNLISDFASRI